MFIGCGTIASENTSEIAPETASTTDTNANEETVELEKEVPVFNDAQTALKRGVEYLDANYITQAINSLRQAVELDKDLAEAHFQLGVALSLKETAEEKTVDDEELAEGDKVKTKKEEKPESEIAFENAVKAYKKVIAKNRKDHAANYNLGRSYSKLYDDENARKALEQAVKLNGEDALYRTELGAVLIKLAQYPSAIKQLNKAIELDEANYRAEDLLVKAKAGKKRVDHAQPDKSQISSRSTSDSSNNARSPSRDSKEKPTPEPKTDKKSPAPADKVNNRPRRADNKKSR